MINHNDEIKANGYNSCTSYIVILHILYALSFLIFLSTVPGDPASA
jgi:hypothetical protein